MSEWAAVEADLKDIGIDVGDQRIMFGRSWRWGKATILGLLTRPVAFDIAGNPQCTRLQASVMPSRPATAAATS